MTFGILYTYYEAGTHASTAEVRNYGYYYLGCIICTKDTPRRIIDGQQRLTSLTLLLIYLCHLQKKQAGIPSVAIEELVYKDDYGVMAFNIDVPERNDCMRALWKQDNGFVADNESTQNLWNRYADIEELFPDDLKGETLPYFIYWLKGKVLLLEIEAPSEDDAHTIFLTMNDRGLSLNSAEMLKAYVIQQVDEIDRKHVNEKWQSNINELKVSMGSQSSGTVKAEDVDFISTWLRSKYAVSIHETKKGAEDRDFERLGEKFHTWVREYARSVMGLTAPAKFKDLVLTEMTQMTKLYLRIKRYSEKLTNGYEAVFYNANRDITYQSYLIMAAVRVDDTHQVIDKKIQMISRFIDIFASRRIFNYKKVNWNTNKQLLFKIMKQIRNQDLKTVGIMLVSNLQRMHETMDTIENFELNQFTGRYMLHMLARLTDHVNLQMGLASQFSAYIDRSPRTSYDIEHVLPDDYQTYAAFFNDEDDFEAYRRKMGNLIILTSDHNRSYRDMPYEEKVLHYPNDNILAQSLNAITYTNNPQFLRVQSRYGFRPYEHFDKEAIRERMQVYTVLAKEIWNADAIKEIAGGWDDERELVAQRGEGRCFTVEYGNGRSWPDAQKWGFVSAGSNGSLLSNIKNGDFIFCHIAGVGFVGIGICMSTIVPMEEFIVVENGGQRKLMDCKWLDETAKELIDPNTEYVLAVKWLRTVSTDFGYWERGMTSLPIVAYTIDDGTTYQKVLHHFNLTIV